MRAGSPAAAVVNYLFDLIGFQKGRFIFIHTLVRAASNAVGGNVQKERPVGRRGHVLPPGLSLGFVPCLTLTYSLYGTSTTG